MVVTADEVGAPNISDVLESSKKSELLGRLGEAREYIAKLEAGIR